MDIYRSANELIKQHGDKALVHAAMRADELKETCDMDGRAAWLRIVKAIEELLANRATGGPNLAYLWMGYSRFSPSQKPCQD